jgi:hypothetical protein
LSGLLIFVYVAFGTVSYLAFGNQTSDFLINQLDEKLIYVKICLILYLISAWPGIVINFDPLDDLFKTALFIRNDIQVIFASDPKQVERRTRKAAMRAAMEAVRKASIPLNEPGLAVVQDAKPRTDHEEHKENRIEDEGKAQQFINPPEPGERTRKRIFSIGESERRAMFDAFHKVDFNTFAKIEEQDFASFAPIQPAIPESAANLSLAPFEFTVGNGGSTADPQAQGSETASTKPEVPIFAAENLETEMDAADLVTMNTLRFCAIAGAIYFGTSSSDLTLNIYYIMENLFKTPVSYVLPAYLYLRHANPNICEKIISVTIIVTSLISMVAVTYYYVAG